MMITLNSILLKSGDTISLNCKICANRPWFIINQQSLFTNASLYDGTDFDTACDKYFEVLLAFRGINSAEQFIKNKQHLFTKVDCLMQRYKNERQTNVKPLITQERFLGFSSF